MKVENAVNGCEDGFWISLITGSGAKGSSYRDAPDRKPAN
jgi:hypothetical protein